jgi:P pilus assembly chaperone PapD
MSLTLSSWKSADFCARKRRRAAILCIVLSFALFQGRAVHAQTIAPVVVEYKGKASGRFQITNNGLTPMAVVLEPESFGVGLDGRPIYRPLDPTIHIDLSTMSFQIGPKQSYLVFYKAHADVLPAWFTLYSILTSPQPENGLKLRIMLPHTVYLYQPKPINKAAIHIQQAVYRMQSNTIVCDLENTSPALVRVQEIRASGGKESAEVNGFPLLPNGKRHLEIPWKQKTPPSYLILRFPHFVVKEPLSVKDE